MQMSKVPVVVSLVLVVIIMISTGGYLWLAGKDPSVENYVNDGDKGGTPMIISDDDAPSTPEGPSGGEPGGTPTPDTPSEEPEVPGEPEEPDEPGEPQIPETPPLVKQRTRSWTSLFYVAYDNSIGPMDAWESDLHHLELVGSTGELNLVALVDQEIEGDCEVLFIQKGYSFHYPVSSVDPDWSDELNTGDPHVLEAFVFWAMEMFPANNIQLHFMDHGGGWWGAGIDETDDGWIESWEMGEALENATRRSGKRIDLISFDACFMANMEMGYQLSGAVDILVGYEPMAVGDEGEDGYMTGNIEFMEIWPALAEDPDMDPEVLATTMVNSANIIGPYTFPQLGMTHVESSDSVGAFRLDHHDELKDSMDALSRELYESVTGDNEVLAERQLILDIIGTPGSHPDLNTESFSGQPELCMKNGWKLYDMYDLCERLAERGDLLCNNETARTVLGVLDQMIIACSHGEDHLKGEHPDAHGLTIHVPFRTTNMMDLYLETSWARDTYWDEFLLEVPWQDYE